MEQRIIPRVGFNRHKRRVLMSSWAVAWALMVTFGMISTAEAAVGDPAPVHPGDGSPVREWLVLGPFASTDLDLLAEAGGEANVRPREGDTVLTGDGKRLVWTRLRSPQDIVNLERVIGLHADAAAYAYCELQSESPRERHVRALANERTSIRLNGEMIGASSAMDIATRHTVPDLRVQLKAGVNRCLLRLTPTRLEWSFIFQLLPTTASLVAIQIVDSAQTNVPGALVQFHVNGRVVAFARTDEQGKAAMCLDPVAESYDVRATFGEAGTWLFDVKLQPGERRRLDLSLSKPAVITGQVLALDNSPQRAIVVQAIRVTNELRSAGADPISEGPATSTIPILPIPPFSETVTTDTNGHFRFVNLRPGRYQLRSHGSDRYISPEATNGTTAGEPTSIEISPGQTREGVRFYTPEIKKGVWRSYPITLGLREVHPFSIHRTPDGLLWIGTDESFLQTFDGLEFKEVASSPEIPANEIRTLEHSADGAMWIGTFAGVVRHFAGRTEGFPLNETLPRKRVNAILADADETVWVAGDSGLYRFNGRDWSAFTTQDGLPSNSIGALLRARDGVLWLGTSLGLVRMDGQNVALAPPPHDYFQYSANSLHEARDGSIWFATFHGAYRYDGKTFFRLGVENGLLSSDVRDIAGTSDGALWFATSRGLAKFNGTTVVNYTVSDGLSNQWVRRIWVDADDVVWCANGWGISRFDPKGLVTFTGRDGLRGELPDTSEVLTIEPDPAGGALIGTGWGGVFRIDGEKLQRISSDTERYYVRRIVRTADGTLWFGGNDGLWKYEQRRFVRVLQRDWVTALCADLEGNLWFGRGWAGGGLFRFNPKTGECTVFNSADGLPGESVWSLLCDSAGDIWIGMDEGLARLRDGKIEDFRGVLGRMTGGVFHLRSEAERTLWIGSRLGLHRWQNNQLFSLTFTNGLPDQHIWSSARSPDGVLWMGTDHYGLIGHDGKAATVIDLRDGLDGTQILGLTAEADGSLLAGAHNGGVTRYRPAKAPLPSIRLTAMQLNDQIVTNFTRLPTILTGNRVTFQYREIDLRTHPQKRQFWYEMVGPGNVTMAAAVTKDRRFDWTPRAAGTYRFEVQAIDRDLNYSAPARLVFLVSVPWFANAWILTPMIGSFAGLLAWAFIARQLYVRKSREAALLRERMRIARDLHDHVGAGLTDLALAGDLVRQQFDQPGAAQVLTTRLTESARELTRTMGEAIWMIDPEKDSLRSFLSFVSSYTERFFAGSPLRLRFAFPNEIPNLILPSEFRHSLFMVVKEALNNVAKHAEASEVRLIVHVDHRELRIGIEDDGAGFGAVEPTGDGRGLTYMQQRLREWHGELRIESRPGEGTRVHARVRIPRA